MGRYPDDMDRECIALCDFINSRRGLTTFASCCGHSQHAFRIFFFADNIDSLRALVEPLSMGTAWSVSVGWANGGERTYFYLEGPSDPAHGDQFAAWLWEQSE